MNLNQKGFTIPELVTMMFVGLLFAGLIIFFTFNFWRSGALQQADQETLITRLNIGDYIRENIGESSGLITQNGIQDSHVLKADPAQPSGLYWLPIHALSGANIPVGNNGVITPLLYFLKFSYNPSNNIIMNGNIPFEDEYVLYLNGTTKQLLARTIANPNAANNRVKTSCPPDIATPPTCPADKIVARDVASIDVRYFSRNGSLINYQSSTDPNSSPPGAYNGPDFPVVEVVELKLNIQKKAEFEKNNSTFNSTIIRIALRNS